MSGKWISLFINISSNVSLLYLPGGYFANSLAIMTDAAHLLSDFAGFMISLLALWVATKPATTTLSFGWHRAGNETGVRRDKSQSRFQSFRKGLLVGDTTGLRGAGQTGKRRLWE